MLKGLGNIVRGRPSRDMFDFRARLPLFKFLIVLKNVHETQVSCTVSCKSRSDFHFKSVIFGNSLKPLIKRVH